MIKCQVKATIIDQFVICYFIHCIYIITMAYFIVSMHACMSQLVVSSQDNVFQLWFNISYHAANNWSDVVAFLL